MGDEWHIRIDKRYLDPVAGSAARRKADELAAGKGTVRRRVERLLDVPTADRSWTRGAQGEEMVAARLAKKLDDRWRVIHDLTIGTRGANLDHLVIGPAGLFVLNTKNLRGKLTVLDRAVLHNGQNHQMLPKARNEATKVSQRLTTAIGRPVHARAVIVLTGPAELTVRGTPPDVRILGYLRLPKWLTSLPMQLRAGEVLSLERAARDPATWSPPRRDPEPAHGGQATRPRAREAEARAAEPGSTGDADITVRRWARYGKDRFYANARDGARLGYIEVATGEVVLTAPDPTGTTTAWLEAARRGRSR